MRPLDGIAVVTLEHAISAPFCTRQLADLGARVMCQRPAVFFVDDSPTVTIHPNSRRPSARHDVPPATNRRSSQLSGVLCPA